MKKVLHLASWYPNRTGPQDGDFIQRQLKAIAMLMPVHVITVVKDVNMKAGTVETERRQENNLSETVAYYNSRKSGIKKLDALISFYTYQRIFRRLVREHVSINGKPDLIHLHVAIKAGPTTLWAASRYGLPYIVSEHWSGYKRQDSSGIYSQPWVTRSIIRKVLNGAKLIIPVSKGLWDDIKAITNNSAYEIVPNVVDESLFEPPVEKEQHRFRLLHVSTMGPEKRPELLFRAFDEFRTNADAELICLGTVPPGLKDWVAGNIRHASDIIFKGNVSYETVAHEMRHANCLLIASRYETFSCVAAEALLSGLPLISTPVGIVPELVNETNGVIVSDEPGLVRAMRQIHDHPEAYNRIGIAEAQKGKFSYQQVGNKLIRLYDTV